ncbi:MAG: LolA family protein, partial [Stackebrandtia sp.]
MRTRTARRLAIPIAIVTGLVITAVTVTIVSANSASDLPNRSAAQLLADMHDSDVDGLSGTLMQNADLGLPDLGDAGLAAVAAGSNQIRLWYAAPDRVRIAVLDDLGESDLIRNGADVWTWSGHSSEASHVSLPEPMADTALWSPADGGGVTPKQAARQALAAIEPTTEVVADGVVRVAERDAFRLVLRPKDDASLIAELSFAIDAETGVPLRTSVIAVGHDEPSFDVAFSRVQFGVPDSQNFHFTPPADVTVTEATDELADWWQHGRQSAKNRFDIVGDGWSRVLVTDFDIDKFAAENASESEFDPRRFVTVLPSVSGDWGSGRLFTSALLNVLITDDGKLILGSVTPQRLY